MKTIKQTKPSKRLAPVPKLPAGFVGFAQSTVKAGELVSLTTKRLRRPWYQYITPLLGIKWGAEVTLIAYVGLYQQSSPGYTAAAWIVAVFLLIEWCTIAYKDFKRSN